MNAPLPAPLDVKLMNWTASALFVCCAALVLAAGARWLLGRPAFAIHRIVVQGDLVHNNAVSLRPMVMPSLAGNFFTVDLEAVRAAFAQAPWVRSVQVRREFPSGLRVVLREHDAVALWGAESESKLLNSDGEVFEAEADDEEQDSLPRLQGPQGQAGEVLAMYHRLVPVFEPLGLELDELQLSVRGGWRAQLDSGAAVELGGGTPEAVVARTQRFARTLAQVAQQYRRSPEALESADLRHDGGYAVRLRGVTTVSDEKAAKKVR